MTPTNLSGQNTDCPTGSQGFRFENLSSANPGQTFSQNYSFGGQSGTVSITLSSDSPITSVSFNITGGALAVRFSLSGGMGPPGAPGATPDPWKNAGYRIKSKT